MIGSWSTRAAAAVGVVSGGGFLFFSVVVILLSPLLAEKGYELRCCDGTEADATVVRFATDGEKKGDVRTHVVPGTKIIPFTYRTSYSLLQYSTPVPNK